MDKGFTLCPTCGTMSGIPDTSSAYFWQEVFKEAWHDFQDDAFWRFGGIPMGKEAEWGKTKLGYMEQLLYKKYCEKEREWEYKNWDTEYRTRRTYEYIHEPYGSSPFLEECEECIAERQPKVLIARPQNTSDPLIRRHYKLIRERPNHIGPNDVRVSSSAELIKKLKGYIDFEPESGCGFSWFTTHSSAVVWYKYPVFNVTAMRSSGQPLSTKRNIVDTAMKCGNVIIPENMWEDSRIINDDLYMKTSTYNTVVNPEYVIIGTPKDITWIHVIHNPSVVTKIRAEREAALKKRIDNGEVPMELIKEYRDFLRTLVDAPWVWRDPKKKTRYDWFKEILLLVQMCDAVAGNYAHTKSPIYDNIITTCLPYTKGLMKVDNEHAVGFGRWINRETSEVRDQIGARVLDLGT